jgi:hypothetical protein
MGINISALLEKLTIPQLTKNPQPYIEAEGSLPQ